ncbi:MarR family transcriptional regulator [Streptomyces chartreusis]|uniref:MarR family transcriptional regulator n=1 Tax=Streptomyces chartreusis TaxID=1969 RepID=UPI00369CE342
MASNALHEELMHQLSTVGAVRRELGRTVPADCSEASATVLTLPNREDIVSIRKLTELRGIDISVPSRRVTHLAMPGWVDRRPPPADRRSRLVRLTDEGRNRFAELSERRSQELRRTAEQLEQLGHPSAGHAAGPAPQRLRRSFAGTVRACEISRPRHPRRMTPPRIR